MAGDDPYQEQWNLRPRIDALRAEATSVRTQNIETYKAKETELAVNRDRLAREQFGLEQQAKSADIQVDRETKDAERRTKDIEKHEASAAAAERRGDDSVAQEHREAAAVFRAQVATHEARARQATLDGAELREQAAGVNRRVVELEVERDDVIDRSNAVERELDKMEHQADLYQQARQKYAEASIASDDIPRRATLELEAEALVKQAHGIDVDRDVIRVVIPDLPETTPGIDADPGPLPPGSDDASSMTEPTEDDSVASAGEAPATAGAASELGDDQAAIAADDESEAGAAVTAGGDALGEEVFTDTASGQSFEISGFDATFEESSPSAGESGFDTAIEPAAALDATAAPTDFGAELGEDTFEAPAAVVDPLATDSLGSGMEDSFASSDFAAPAEPDLEFAPSDGFESETFEA